MARRFYFDVDNGKRLIIDDNGVQASNLKQALADAQHVIGEMESGPNTANSNSPWTLIVRDETGLILARIPLSLSSNPQQ